MLRLTIISVLIAVAVARTPGVRQPAPKLDGRIVGGQMAAAGEFPYQLSLQYNDNHICGASIISPTRVLTAAHCTNGKKATNFKVYAGSLYTDRGGQAIKVEKICQHPKYNVTYNVDNDVSVLRLATPLTMGPNVQAIEIDDGQDIYPGDVGTISGWGRLQPNNSAKADQLRKVQIPNVDTDNCRDLYEGYHITQNMICFGHPEGGKDSCQGDSGGPLVLNGKQVGVVSWGLGCAQPNTPGVYAYLASLSIRDHLADTC